MSTVKHIDTNGLLYYSTLIRQALAGKIDTGNADKNVLEGVKIDGTALSISSKAVNIPLASSSVNGAMSSTDKSHLDELYEDSVNYAYLSDIGVVNATTSSSSPTANDYWKDGNVLKIYNGTSWEAVSSLKIVRLVGSGNSTEGIYLYIPNTGFTELGTSSDVAAKVADVTVNGTSIVNSTTKVAALTVDSAATNNSSNPIASDAVYDINAALSGDISRLDKRVVLIDYIATEIQGGPVLSMGTTVSNGEIWYDVTNKVLKKYKGDPANIWQSYGPTSNIPVIIGVKKNSTADTPPDVYIFTYDDDVLKVGDNAAITSALALKAPLASPALTGTPTAPTATAGTNTTQVATTAFVQTAIAAAVTGSFKFVNSLPTTGEAGYIYLVPHTHSGSSTNTNPDVKDEYIWNTSASPAQWELIGNTDLDLSNYWNKTDLATATNEEVLACWEDSASS